MNCQKCGSPLVPGDKFCKTCGAATEAMPEQNTMLGDTLWMFVSVLAMTGIRIGGMCMFVHLCVCVLSKILV